MHDRSVTGCSHRLLIRPGFVHLEANTPSTEGVRVVREACFCQQLSRCVTCKYHKAFLSETKKFSQQQQSTQASVFVRQCTHAPGPDYFMVSPKYTVPSVKWGFKGAVVSLACVFPDSKVLFAEGHHLLHAEPAVWHLSAALEKATLQLVSGEKTRRDILESG